MSTIARFTLSACLSAAPALAQTTTVTIPASQDATIYRMTGTCGVLGGTSANGAGQFLVANIDNCADEYNAFALMRFDVAAVLPPGTTIVSARLEVDIVQVFFGYWMTLHGAAASWTEGASSDPPDPEWIGVPPAPGDVTWLYRSYPTLAWTAGPMGGNDATVWLPSQPGTFLFQSSPGVVGRVQSWVNSPSSNHGWIVRSDDEIRVASREHPSLAGPRLVVEYLPPPCSTGLSYCSAAPNSTGIGATLGMSGSAQISQNDCTLTLSGGVPGSIGFFFFGDQTQQTPWGNGFLCVHGQLYRLLPAVPFTASGTAARPLDFSTGPATLITPGSRWNFQCKYRDVAGGGALFNSSDGLGIIFCP